LDTLIVVLGKTVHQQTVHVRQWSSFSVTLYNSFFRTSGLQIVLILVRLTVEYGAWLLMQYHVYQIPVRDVIVVKQCLINTWH